MQMITKVTWLFWTNQDITKSKKSAVLIIVVGQWYQLVPVALCHWCLTKAFSAVCDLLIKALKMGHVQVGMTYVKTCLQIFVREIETRWKEFFPPMMFAFRIQFGSSLLKEFIIRDERERENERERWSSKALRFDQTLRQKFLAGNKIIEFCRIWQSMLGIYFTTPRRRRRSVYISQGVDGAIATNFYCGECWSITYFKFNNNYVSWSSFYLSLKFIHGSFKEHHQFCNCFKNEANF